MASNDDRSHQDPNIQAPRGVHLPGASRGAIEHSQTGQPSRSNGSSLIATDRFSVDQGGAYLDEPGFRPPLPPRPPQAFQPLDRRHPLAYSFASASTLFDPPPLPHAGIHQGVTQRQAIVTEQPSNLPVEMRARQDDPRRPLHQTRPFTSPGDSNACGCDSCSGLDCGGLAC